METKHTPGPWRVLALDWESDATGKISAGIAEPNEPPHAVICDSMSCDPMADARLIAAAPDLLAALEAIVALDDGDAPDLWHFENEFRRARNALAKARGE